MYSRSLYLFFFFLEHLSDKQAIWRCNFRFWKLVMDFFHYFMTFYSLNNQIIEKIIGRWIVSRSSSLTWPTCYLKGFTIFQSLVVVSRFGLGSRFPMIHSVLLIFHLHFQGDCGRQRSLHPKRRKKTMRLPRCPLSLSSHMTPQRLSRRRRSHHHHPRHTVDPLTLPPPRHPPIVHAPLRLHPPLPPRGAKLMELRAPRGHIQAPVQQHRKNARG